MQTIKSPRLGVRSFRVLTCVLMWFNKDDTLADSSSEHATFCLDNGTGASFNGSNKVQGQPVMEASFSHRHISVFSKDRLSFKACWVNVVRASMYAVVSSFSMEGTKTVAK